jgi:hypothetical protein
MRPLPPVSRFHPLLLVLAAFPARHFARTIRTAVLSLVVFPLTVNAAGAGCTSSIMPIFQCRFEGWFAPAPVGTGTVSTVWWQIGYGNNRVNNGVVCAAACDNGTGIGPAGVFSGNDSGIASVWYDLRPIPARAALPEDAALIPEGSLCLGENISWALGGVDNCPDNCRTTAAADNDNLLNPYWGMTYGPCSYDGCLYETMNYQIDYPMALLLRESTNRFFALAFVATRTRQGDSTDTTEGFYDLAEVSNGDLNPVSGKLNVIPWQPVPRPRVNAIGPAPGTETDRLISFSWDDIRLIHDGSTRPSPRVILGGVGVLEQATQAGGLCRYQVQTAVFSSVPVDPSTLAWSNSGAPISCPGGGTATLSAQVIVPASANTAIRIRTILGKQPRTTSTFLANTRLGASGDLGFEATRCLADNCVESPPLTLISGPLVSEQAVDTVAERNRNAVVVRFRTTSELTVSGIDLLGKLDGVVASVPCTECTSGVGADYEVVLTPGELKGARTLRVRLNGPGVVSSPFPVQ